MYAHRGPDSRESATQLLQALGMSCDALMGALLGTVQTGSEPVSDRTMTAAINLGSLSIHAGREMLDLCDCAMHAGQLANRLQDVGALQLVRSPHGRVCGVRAACAARSVCGVWLLWPCVSGVAVCGRV